MKVLLVEDNADEEFLTVRILRKFPRLRRVDVARDGVEALDYLNKKGARDGSAPLPRLVLLDLKLPRVDGIEVLRQIRSREETREIPVIVLSSSDHDKDITTCMELGANSYLVKPLDAGRLENELARLGLL